MSTRQQRRHAARKHKTAPVGDVKMLQIDVVGTCRAQCDGEAWGVLATRGYVIAVRGLEPPPDAKTLPTQIAFKIACDLAAGDDMEPIFRGDAGDLREFGEELARVEAEREQPRRGAALLGGAAFPWAALAEVLLPLLADGDAVDLGLIMGPDMRVRLLARTDRVRLLMLTAPSPGGAPALKLPTPQELAARAAEGGVNAEGGEA